MSNDHNAHITDMCRLKTTRRKKRLVKSDRDKHLLEINRMQLKIWKKQRDLGYEELNPPYQRGWERIFVLREDVAATNKAEFFQGILDKINTRQLSHRKDFKKKRKRRGRRVDVERLQLLNRLSEWEFRKAQFTEKEMEYFKEVDEYDPWSKKTYKRYVFTEPWRFVLKVRPNMITHRRIIDPELERIEAELDQYLDKKGYRFRLSKLLHGWARYFGGGNNDEKKKYENAWKNQPLHMLREYYEIHKD